MTLDTANMETMVEFGPSNFIESFLRRVNGNSWILGGKLLLSRVNEPAEGITSWSSGDGDYYTLSTAPSTVPPSPDAQSQFPEEKSIFVIVNSGQWRVVWRVGEAYLQVTKVNTEDLVNEFATTGFIEEEERKDGPLGFKTPNLLHHSEFENREYFLFEKLPGDRLADVWHTLGPKEKQYYAEQTANIVERFPKRYGRFCDLTPYSIVVHGTDRPIGVCNFGTDETTDTAFKQHLLGTQARTECMAKLQKEQTEWRALLHKHMEEDGFGSVWGRIVDLSLSGQVSRTNRPLSVDFWSLSIFEQMSDTPDSWKVSILEGVLDYIPDSCRASILEELSDSMPDSWKDYIPDSWKDCISDSWKEQGQK
ncbi:hypothetical protein BKA56DRAFT_720232 [Ilyonectria sp. MPI-CAGE-AT-0026]|nr:hypothetical protein BKA56DRAFT_720232 [Ilyonectria sp. MPI-CAGE-AT-0026]